LLLGRGKRKKMRSKRCNPPFRKEKKKGGKKDYQILGHRSEGDGMEKKERRPQVG